MIALQSLVLIPRKRFSKQVETMTKRLATLTGGHRPKQVRFNDTKSQRQILIGTLQAAGSAGVTTIEARERLGVMHPGARVLELRRMGWEIATVWSITESARGRKHRNARYVLVGIS